MQSHLVHSSVWAGVSIVALLGSQIAIAGPLVSNK